jgi:hypothetical protein
MSKTNKNAEIKNILSHFKLPVFYNPSKQELNNNIVKDLELLTTANDREEHIYKYIFSPTTPLGESILELFPQFYTTDISFLKDTQQMIKNVHSLDTTYKYQNIINAWNEIKYETGFCEKYLYVDWDFGKFLNTNPVFLQAMSVYNITSPILSLLMPIFILIIPFFVIKLKGVEISMPEYLKVLNVIVANHSIGKIFTKFNDVDISQKIYILVSAAFYVFSIYQNILVCVRFYSNTKKIHDYLLLFNDYIKHTIDQMNSYLSITQNLNTYIDFNDELRRNRDILVSYKNKLEVITPFKISISKILNMGHILRCFYELYDNKDYNDALLYSFGFNGYIDNISGLATYVSNKKINLCTFAKNSKKSNKSKKSKNGKNPKKINIFKNAFYPNLIDKKHKKNSYHLERNIILTGPNASGKTTLLKTTLINIILTQQFGCGCYTSAKIVPFQFIHCYLNIPDTSGRDSLFQAEARRCKEIIDCIHSNPKAEHFCVFDELYSGTNPEEAIVSAQSFMEYISKYKTVSCLLTTHYIQLCKNISNNPRMQNYNMKTIKTEKSLEYTYELQEGISDIKGGLKVLTDMNYPTEIINKAIQF